MIKGSYEAEVLVNGSTVKEYAHEGRTFIEGKKGSSFSIRLRNNTSERKLFVVTVDGLSVMDGKDASINGRGYLVRGFGSMTVDGWRKSDDEVAEFYFASPEDSYRRRQRKGNNLGVIGVVVYGEKKYPKELNIEWVKNIDNNELPVLPWRKHSEPWCQGDAGSIYKSSFLQTTDATLGGSNILNCCSSSHVPSQGLGTGWGKDKRSEVVSVDFERADAPAEVLTIYYNTREQLSKEGIEFKERIYVDRPKAFPGDYCEPPK